MDRPAVQRILIGLAVVIFVIGGFFVHKSIETANGAKTGNATTRQVVAALDTNVAALKRRLSAHGLSTSVPVVVPTEIVGSPGANGLNGAQGAQGPRGFTGLTGTRGSRGRRGATGAVGPMGPVGATGQAGATGATGATGAQGPQGEVGPSGPPGQQGETGPRGADGSPLAEYTYTSPTGTEKDCTLDTPVSDPPHYTCVLVITPSPTPTS